jgi:hypothetical protein
VDSITAIYNFGDSLSDTGNLLREGDATGLLQYTTSLPYGSAIGAATGRCSDGHLMIDFLAKDLGLPLLNPYLDKGADFTHGANFAVAGATALDAAALTRRGVVVPHTKSSLAVQLQWFKDLMSATTKTPEEIREKLAHADGRRRVQPVQLRAHGGRSGRGDGARPGRGAIHRDRGQGAAGHGRDAVGDPGRLPAGVCAELHVRSE